MSLNFRIEVVSPIFTIFVKLLHHVLDLCQGVDLAQWGHGAAQFVRCDTAIVVGIEETECRLELCRNEHQTAKSQQNTKSEIRTQTAHALSCPIIFCNRPVSQIPQCTSPISYNAPFCNRNVHISVIKWCIMRYLSMHCTIDLWYGSIGRLLHALNK